MRRIEAFLVVVFLAGTACSSKDEAVSACADISGNYKVIFTRLSGTCDPSIDGTGAGTTSISRSGDGWQIVIPAIPGGCPATLDPSSCHFISNCQLLALDGGAPLGGANLDYTFSSGSFKGTTSDAFLPPIVVSACQVTYEESGTKL